MIWVVTGVAGYVFAVASVFSQQDSPVLGTLGFLVGLSAVVFSLIKLNEGP